MITTNMAVVRGSDIEVLIRRIRTAALGYMRARPDHYEWEHVEISAQSALQGEDCNMTILLQDLRRCQDSEAVEFFNELCQTLRVAYGIDEEDEYVETGETFAGLDKKVLAEKLVRATVEFKIADARVQSLKQSLGMAAKDGIDVDGSVVTWNAPHIQMDLSKIKKEEALLKRNMYRQCIEYILEEFEKTRRSATSVNVTLGRRHREQIRKALEKDATATAATE